MDLDAWDDAHLSTPSRPRTEKQWHVMLDFDRTITINDTVDALMRTAISLNASSESGKSRFGDDAAGRQTADWEECKAKYESDLRAYQKGLELNNADWDPEVKGAFERTSKRRLPDYRDGKNYLQSEVEIIESQRPLEEVSLARVAGTRILETVSGRRLLECAKGVTRVVREGRFCNGDAEVEAEVSMVEVRSGFKAFAEAIDSRKAAKWGVISVNWSKDWIRGVLSAALERSDEDMARINIISNDLVDSDFISKYRSNGFMENENCKLLLSSTDKIAQLRPLASRFMAEANCQPRPPIIYIGDSAVDLLPLLSAEIGIIILPPSSSSSNPSPHPLVDLIKSCELTVASVRNYKILYHRESAAPTAPDDGGYMDLIVGEPEDDDMLMAADEDEVVVKGNYVRLLVANGFEEILASGLLDDGFWQPSFARSTMVHDLHTRNSVANRLV